MMKTQRENVVDYWDDYLAAYKSFLNGKFFKFCLFKKCRDHCTCVRTCGSVTCWLCNFRESHISICWIRKDMGIKPNNIIGL